MVGPRDGHENYALLSRERATLIGCIPAVAGNRYGAESRSFGWSRGPGVVEACRRASPDESPPQMRVTHAYKIFRPDIEGGIPAVMSQLARLRAGGDDVKVLTVRAQGPSRQFELDGTPISALHSFGEISSMPISPQFPFALKRAAQNCDVLALHAPFPLNDLGLAFGIPDSTAVVVHWHAEILGRKAIMPLVALLVRRTLARADRIVVSDQSIIDGSPFLAPHTGKCVIVPYGIETTEWSHLEEAAQQQANELREQHPRLVISMGRLVPYKGFPVLLKALQRIDGEVVIVGQGSEYENLKRLAAEYGVAERLILAGFLPRSEMKAWLHAARAFVLPSVTTAEAFGIVQIEAMAAGLPVVNTSLPTAVPTIARDGQEGFTVAPHDADALADAINRLLNDPATASRFGAAGRVRVDAEYSEAVFLRRIREVYVDARRSRQPTGHSGAI
jgi:glycosyltransferase involved in cell wall biosynthesis